MIPRILTSASRSRRSFLPGKEPRVPIGYEAEWDTAGLDTVEKKKIPYSLGKSKGVSKCGFLNWYSYCKVKETKLFLCLTKPHILTAYMGMEVLFYEIV
jgi:hypothetical protein